MTRAASNARILVIDDDPAIRDSLRMTLEYQGYAVMLASGGDEGAALVEREAPDLVFLDIKMPGMDGLEVLQRLRPLTEVTPIIVLSGNADIQTAVEATRLGAFDIVEKPLSTDRLLVLVRNALDSRRLRTENRSFRTRPGAPAPDRRRQRRPGRGPRGDRQGGADQRHRADLGRERRRQGAGGAGRPSREPAPRRSRSCRSTAPRSPTT